MVLLAVLNSKEQESKHLDKAVGDQNGIVSLSNSRNNNRAKVHTKARFLGSGQLDIVT